MIANELHMNQNNFGTSNKHIIQDFCMARCCCHGHQHCHLTVTCPVAVTKVEKIVFLLISHNKSRNIHFWTYKLDPSFRGHSNFFKSCSQINDCPPPPPPPQHQHQHQHHYPPSNLPIMTFFVYVDITTAFADSWHHIITITVKHVTAIHDDVIKWGHFPRYRPFVRGNSPVPGEFPAQRPVTRSFDVFFDLRLNKRLRKNREAGDLRHYRAHYDVIVMN